MPGPNRDVIWASIRAHSGPGARGGAAGHLRGQGIHCRPTVV